MPLVTPAQREPELGDWKATKHQYSVEVWLKNGTSTGKRCFIVNANDRAQAGRIATKHCTTEGEDRVVASVNMIG